MIQSLLSSDRHIFHRCRFIFVKTERSGFTPQVVFYVFNPVLTYPSRFRLSTNLLCKNSIRRGLYFCPRQWWVPSLFHCYWSNLKQRAQVRPSAEKAFFFFFLFNRSCVPSPKVGMSLGHPSGWGWRFELLNNVDLPSILSSAPRQGLQEKWKRNTKSLHLLPGNYYWWSVPSDGFGDEI